jgi:hypothetical protein
MKRLVLHRYKRCEELYTIRYFNSRTFYNGFVLATDLKNEKYIIDEKWDAN